MPDFTLPKELQHVSADVEECARRIFDEFAASQCFDAQWETIEEWQRDEYREFAVTALNYSTMRFTERLAKCETVYCQRGGVIYVSAPPPKGCDYATKILPPWELGKDGAG